MAAGDEAVPGVRIPAGRERSSRSGRGAGGRWLIWLFRAVLWAVLLLIGYRGVTAIIAQPAPAGPAAAPAGRAAGSASGFPVSLAEAYALQFGSAYLNLSPATAAQRERELSAFLAPGSDPQLGWNGAGTQRLDAEQVASVAVRDSHHAVVTLLATVNGRLLELGVPIYTASGGLVVSGNPALLPPPARVTPPRPASTASDSGTQAALTSQLAPFFQAYATGDSATLSRFLVPGTRLTGLGGLVRFGSITQVSAPPGGATRHITVTVAWQLTSQASGGGISAASPAMDMTYAMTVVRHEGSWYVRAIGTSVQPPGAP
jgi:hypothetical protein